MSAYRIGYEFSGDTFMIQLIQLWEFLQSISIDTDKKNASLRATAAAATAVEKEVGANQLEILL